MKTHETDLVSSCKCYHFEFFRLEKEEDWLGPPPAHIV